jgi:hypothetical protein
VTVRNQGHVPLARVDLTGTVEGTALQAPPVVQNLAPGQEQTVALHWKPAKDWAGKAVVLAVRAQGTPETAGGAKDVLPATPSIVRARTAAYPTKKAGYWRDLLPNY